MKFHINDSQKKVAEHCKEENVYFEYTNFWDKDEEIFRDARNMTALKRIFKQNITIKGGKSQTTQKKSEEEEAKKREEDARRLAQEAESQLKNEEEERKKEEDEEMKKKQKEAESLRLTPTTEQQTTDPTNIQ